MHSTIRAGVLDIAFLDHGPRDGAPVILLHGFPYDVHTYDAVTPILAAAGMRVIVPWLRGFGPTRFVREDTMRSGQQAAVGADLLALMDALALPRVWLAGYDWGGRAANIVAALWPQRVLGLVSAAGYQVQDIARGGDPREPAMEHRLWYQYYFHGERGRLGLERHRAAMARLLWTQWSPDWRFDDATFERSAASFDNPDFVPITLHSYRHRFGLVGGDPAYDDIEARLATRPAIAVPTISIDGASDGVASPGGSAGDAPRFTAGYEVRTLDRVGHNPAQEAPEAFASAVLDLRARGPRP